jgi:arylsulfatase A-like enzyme
MDPGSQGFDDVLTTHKPGAGPSSKYEEDWHHVREITERAVKFIERNRDKPFFCYITHNSIHDPEVEKTGLVGKYSAKTGTKEEPPGKNNPKQAAMLETLDKSVQTVLQKLDSLGLSDNTMVVFFSDNGQLGPKQSKPLRGSKGDVYEGGIRMPLIFRWPRVIKSGSLCHEPVISNDFFPTFSKIAGKTSLPDNVDGVSLLPLLSQTGKVNRDALYWHFPHYHVLSTAPAGAVRQGKYKLIEWYEKSIFGQEGAIALYDLERDPGEQKNLVSAMPGLASELQEKLKTWRKKVNAQEMVKNPEFKALKR